MKKSLLLIFLAAIVLTGCTSKQKIYDNCVSAAQDQYDIKKDTYCRDSFASFQNSYNNCITNKQNEHPQPIGSYMNGSDGIRRNPNGTPIQNYTIEQATELCKQEYGWRDNAGYNPNCTSKELDASLEREKDRCVELAK